MAVFSPVGQREAGRIPKAVGCPVNDLRDHGERPHRARPDAWRQQEFRKVDGATLGCRSEGAVQPPGEDIAGSDIVVGRHD
jgi:hypothetical protein